MKDERKLQLIETEEIHLPEDPSERARLICEHRDPANFNTGTHFAVDRHTGHLPFTDDEWDALFDYIRALVENEVSLACLVRPLIQKFRDDGRIRDNAHHATVLQTVFADLVMNTGLGESEEVQQTGKQWSKALKRFTARIEKAAGIGFFMDDVITDRIYDHVCKAANLALGVSEERTAQLLPEKDQIVRRPKAAKSA